MKEIFNQLIVWGRDYNLIAIVVRIFLAVVVGGIIGYERGKHGSQAGFRTHILVCLGSMMTSLTGVYASEIMGYSGDPFRIAAQVVSGIGFLGAGMIIVKSDNAIIGLTTAAGMWTTATIGIAIGIGFYIGAILVAFTAFITTTFLTRIERRRKQQKRIYAEISGLSEVTDISEKIKGLFKDECLIEILPPKSGKNGNLGILILTSEVNNIDVIKIGIKEMSTIEFVVTD